MTSSVKESRDIKNELKGLGDVNIGAIKEYEISQRKIQVPDGAA
jgi:chromosome segregation ATPase